MAGMTHGYQNLDKVQPPSGQDMGSASSAQPPQYYYPLPTPPSQQQQQQQQSHQAAAAASSSTPLMSSADAQSSLCRTMAKLNLGNPFPSSMRKRCLRASRVISEHLTLPQEQAIINDQTIMGCKGLAIISTVKAGYIWSGRFGSGVVVARLEDGTWSPPTAISCVGIGYGAQAGLEFSDLVIVLKDDNALNAFMQLGNVSVGASLGLALGPWGRSAECGFAATCALLPSLSKSRGLYGGLALELTGFAENRKTLARCYGPNISSKMILAGEVPANSDVKLFMDALNQRFPPSAPSPAPSPAPESAASFPQDLKENPEKAQYTELTPAPAEQTPYFTL